MNGLKDQRQRTIRITPKNIPAKPILLNVIGATKIVLEPGSKATIFEEISLTNKGSGMPAHRSLGEGGLSAEISIEVQKGAELHYIALVHPKNGSPPMNIVRSSRTAAGGSIHWYIVTLGGNGDRHELISELTGKGATSSIDWISYLRGNEKQSVSVRNIFNAPSGGGEITMKSVAEGKASATLHGMIEITEKGKGTATHLTEDALMLDSTAKIDAIPALEIRTNDVKASHSAAISRVSGEQLFYILSRGIPETQARRMFIEGFLAVLTSKIPENGIREKIINFIQKAMNRI
ncbi:MAG: SufD family Fe-S cluster assembly protein [Candidatus Peribacteraceae bacterium]|nr:SufD family Fe-S cluster assembly protein [Candidatus Peribacteraceae bacterium]